MAIPPRPWPIPNPKKEEDEKRNAFIEGFFLRAKQYAYAVSAASIGKPNQPLPQVLKDQIDAIVTRHKNLALDGKIKPDQFDDAFSSIKTMSEGAVINYKQWLAGQQSNDDDVVVPPLTEDEDGAGGPDESGAGNQDDYGNKDGVEGRYISVEEQEQLKAAYGEVLTMHKLAEWVNFIKNGGSFEDLLQKVKDDRAARESDGQEPGGGGGGPSTSDNSDDNSSDSDSGITQSTTPATYNDFVKKVFKNYIGREPTPAELLRDTGALAGGMSKNDFLITASQSPEAVARRDKVMAGDKNEFDAVVAQVWKDYFGTDPDPASVRVHGAALKGGMSIEDFREMVQTAPSAGMVTDGQINDQNSMMANAVQASNNVGTYLPSPTYGTPLPGFTSPAPGSTVTPSPQPQDDANTSYVKQVYKNYLGRTPTAAELSRDVGFLNGGGSQNAFLLEATKSDDAVTYRNKVMAGDKGEFDAVVAKIFQDYAGVNPDPASIKIHGAALKGGMSIQDFRINMLTAPVVQAHVASNPVTDGMVNDQNSMMANAVQVADANNTYVPSIDNVMATAVVAATAMVNPAAPEVPAPAAPVSPAPDPASAAPAPAAPAPNELSYAQKEQMNSIWFKYTGRNMDEGDLAIHGPALISGSKTMGQLEQEVANSPEALRFMAPNNYDYINKAFKNYLGRDVDRAGLEIWNNNLNSGTTRSQALVSIANSDEGKAYTNKMAYINEHDSTVDGIWNKYGINASAQDKVIHGAALKGGMSASDLDGYVAQAVGMPGYSQNP